MLGIVPVKSASWPATRAFNVAGFRSKEFAYERFSQRIIFEVASLHDGDLKWVNLRLTAEVFMSRLQGTVKWFDAKKGFGFVLSPEGKDVFVHFSSIEDEGFRTLKDGEMVEYELVTGEKGLSAKAVRRLTVKPTTTADRGSANEA